MMQWAISMLLSIPAGTANTILALEVVLGVQPSSMGNNLYISSQSHAKGDHEKV